MSNSWENLWVSWKNSDKWRQFAKWGPGARLFQSQAYRKFDVARRFATTYYKSRQQPALFQDVKTFCMFVGQAKSGGSLIGSLLDAHPDIILADEVDVLNYVSIGFSREQIFHLLLKGSRREAMKGRVTARRLTPYSLAVPDQWQGRYRHLQAIGFSKAGPSTRRFSQEPELVGELMRVMEGVDTKFIQVIRNPYDPISLMMVRGKRTFANAIDHYFDYCETLMALRKQVDKANLLSVRYEEFVRQPRTHLDNICRYLGLDVTEDYLDACVSIVYDSPERSRTIVEWNADWIDVVRNRIAQVDFLSGYTYDN